MAVFLLFLHALFASAKLLFSLIDFWHRSRIGRIKSTLVHIEECVELIFRAFAELVVDKAAKLRTRGFAKSGTVKLDKRLMRAEHVGNNFLIAELANVLSEFGAVPFVAAPMVFGLGLRRRTGLLSGVRIGDRSRVLLS